MKTQIADVEVNDPSTLESLSGVAVSIFDNFFTHGLPDTTVRSDFLLLRRPDWGGMILESLLTINQGDYKNMCLKMEELMSDVMHQRDMWTDRFFFKAIEADSDALCGYCKEDIM